MNNELWLSSEGGGGGPTPPTPYSIDRSLRFNSSDSAYLSRTPASAGNRKTWTWAGWVKRSALGEGIIFYRYPTAGTGAGISFSTSDTLVLTEFASSVSIYNISSSAVFRDLSAWYHIVAVTDTSNATSTERVRLYVNGERITSFGTATYPSLNYDGLINQAALHTTGRREYAPAYGYFNGYLADIHFIDGQALDPTSFGEFDTNGIWQPIAYTGSYGTNGFHLPFSDNSTAAALGTDTSGAGNDWTVNNISVAAGSGNDSLVDTPTNYGTDTGAGGEVRGNYCTLNPLNQTTNPSTVSQGNLYARTTATTWYRIGATIFVSSGKWYWEYTPTELGLIIGGVGTNEDMLGAAGLAGVDKWLYYNTGTKFGPGVYNVAYGASYTVNDVIGVALDMDAGTLTFYKNGVSQGTAFTGLVGHEVAPAVELTGYGGGTNTGAAFFNFGQRPFAYPAPSGYKALCTTNLPDPVVAKPSEVMDVKLYTGNGSTQTISGLGFSPDLVWNKVRNASYWHSITDTVRGATKTLYSNDPFAEFTDVNSLQAFTSDGFTLGSQQLVNESAKAYVAWTWDAGSSTVTNTDGSITSQVRANPSAGFSIVTFTAQSSGSGTIGHGLGVTPEFVIVKSRAAAYSWIVWHKSLTSAAYSLILNTTAAQSLGIDAWNNTLPTSSVFSLGAAYAGATNSVAYCFAPVDGYSSFGSYTGNGSTDGPFVYTGFRPRWIMWKRTDVAQDWVTFDAARGPINPNSTYLWPNLSDAELTAAASIYGLDMLSNGWKIRGTSAYLNASGGTYVFAAFAENPFKYARAR